MPTTPSQVYDANYRPIGYDLYDPVSGQYVAPQASGVTSAGGISYAPSAGTISGPTPGDPYTATVFAPGELRVSMESSQVFYDAYDTGLDTTNRYKPPAAGGGGIPASNTLTYTALGSGVAANGYSFLESQMSFYQVNPGWLAMTTAINIEYPVLTNAYRFWGFGTSPLTPTATAALTDACGFEVATNGKMYAVTYQGGTRIVIQDLSATTGSNKQPTDTAVHKYSIFYRGDNIFYAIDGLDAIVAQTTTGGPGPNVNALPLKFTAIAASTPPASNAALTVNAVWVGDTARNNQRLSDGVFPWRMATVAQFHNADNQALPVTPAAYGILTGGVAQIINGLGNLDRQREAGLDQISPIGLSASAANFAQAFQTSVPVLGNIPPGAASAAIVPASFFGILVGALLTLDTGANAEMAVVTAVTPTTATIVPTNTVGATPAFKSSHTVPYQVTGFVYNQERDQNGELDLPRGVGMAVAMPMLSLSSGQGASNPIIAVRERGVQGLGLSPVLAISGSVPVGATSLTLLVAPAGLLAGSALYLTGGPGGGYERVITALNYTPGSTSVVLDPATPVVGAGRTAVQYMAFAAGGPAGNAFYPEGEGAEFQAAIDLTATSGPPGRLLQVATQNNAPYANSPLESIGLDNSAGLDRMMANQNLALINANNATTTITTPDQVNINAHGVKVSINITNIGAGSITVSIQFKDPFGLYTTVLSSVVLTTNGQTVLTICPGLFNIANATLNDFLPRIWRVQAVANNNAPATYTVGAMTIVS